MGKYSDNPPIMVMPDTHLGREDARRGNYHADDLGFCGHYIPERSDARPRMCENRRREGDRRFNWCFKCLAGFIILPAGDDDLEPEKYRASKLKLTW